MRPLSESLPMLLLRAREVTMGFFRPILNEYGLSEQQWRVLRILYDNPGISAQVLAQLSYISSPSLSRILSRLDKEKLISRRRSAEDHREQIIRLAEGGEHLFEKLSPILEEAYSDIRESFKSDRLDNLYELLKEFLDIDAKNSTKR